MMLRAKIILYEKWIEKFNSFNVKRSKCGTNRMQAAFNHNENCTKMQSNKSTLKGSTKIKRSVGTT